MQYFSRGFTILELLVAIAIVGVLASITGVAVIGFTDEADSSNTLIELRQTPNLAATYRGDTSNNGYNGFCSSTGIASVVSDNGATCVDGKIGYVIHLVTSGTNQLCISSNTYGKVVKTTTANIDNDAFSCGSAILSSNSGGGGGNTNTNTNIPISTSTSRVTTSRSSANGAVVIIDSNGNETLSVADVSDNSRVRLKVIPDSGFLFDGWGKNLKCLNDDSFSSICDFDVTGDLSVRVSFVAKPTTPPVEVLVDVSNNIPGIASHNGRLYVIRGGSKLATIHPLTRNIEVVSTSNESNSFGNSVGRASGLASLNGNLYLIGDQYNALYLLGGEIGGVSINLNDGLSKRLNHGDIIRLAPADGSSDVDEGNHSMLSFTEHNGELLYFTYDSQTLKLYAINGIETFSTTTINGLTSMGIVPRSERLSISSPPSGLTEINSMTSHNGELYILGGDGKLYRADFTNSQIVEVGGSGNGTILPPSGSGSMTLKAIVSHNGQLYLAADLGLVKKFLIVNINNNNITTTEVTSRTLNLSGGVTVSQPDSSSATPGHQVVSGELIVFTRPSNTSRFTGACFNTERTCELVIPLTGSSTITIGSVVDTF